MIGGHLGGQREEAPEKLLLLQGFIHLVCNMEATGGFEPPNRGFADLRLKPLGYVAVNIDYLASKGFADPRQIGQLVQSNKPI